MNEIFAYRWIPVTLMILSSAMTFNISVDAENISPSLILYSVDVRAPQSDADGSSAHPFNTLQAAHDKIAQDIASHATDTAWVQPSFTVRIHAGTFENQYTACKGNVCNLLNVSVSGTASAPITFEPYGDGSVILKGIGFVDADVNGDGFADGPPDTKKREILINLTGKYVTMKGLELHNSSGKGMLIQGSFNTIENVSSHDNWSTNFDVGGGADVRVEGNVLRNVESYRCRHGTGVLLTRVASPITVVTKNLVVDSLSYNNGYQPDGVKVLPITGDPQGGGNSDGFGAAKQCGGATYTESFCPENVYRGTVSFGNADDGYDVNFSDSLMHNNIAFFNGPNGNKGYKVFLTTVKRQTWIGNIAYANLDRGFEIRSAGGFTFINNTSVGNVNQGIVGITGDTIARNNMSAFNGGNDFPLIAASCPQCSANWAKDGSGGNYRGDPQLIEIHPFRDSSGNIVVSFPPNLTIAQKVSWIKGVFKSSFGLRSNSGAVDKGLSTVFKEPQTGEFISIPYYGSAPDIGAVEFQENAESTLPRPAPATNVRAR